MPGNYKLGYRPDIEGLRAIAILLVVAAHIKLPGFQGGFIGVDMFFVLSGYLITALLALETEATGDVDMWRFYARRLRRLAPGLFIVSVASCLLAWVLLPPLQQTAQVGAAASAMVWLSNFFYAFSQIDYFGPGAEESLFLHTWSLGVEEQFYLVWPWFMLLLTLEPATNPAQGTTREARESQVRRWKWMMWLVFSASLALCLVLMRQHPASAFYMMPARAWQFSLGGLTWLCLRDMPSPVALRTAFDRVFIELCGWLGLAAIALALLWCGPDVPYPGVRAVLPSLGAALLLAAGSRHRPSRNAGGTVMSLLHLRPMQALGHVSYSWYLWHWPILVLGAAVCTDTSLTVRIMLALIALILAWITFCCVEQPIRRREALLRRPAPMVVGVMTLLIAGSLLCPLWLSSIESRLFDPEHQEIMAISRDLPKIYGMGCDDWHENTDIIECTFGEEDAPNSAVFLGDSIGAQWFPALKQRFTQPGWKLSVFTKSACPIIDRPIFYARIGRDYVECALWRKGVLEMLRTRHTNTIVLGSSHDYAVTPRDWTEGTRKILQVLSPRAKEIVLIRSTPILPFNALYCLTGNNRLTRFLAGGDRCRAPAANAQNDVVYAALQTAAASFGNVRTLDMNDAICPGGTCRAKQDGYVAFRDNHHLTTRFVQHLGEEFIRRLETANDPAH
ncbi:MAG: acyltransferase [Zoogloeaceae bacterium]|jgi:peptidoglycan/LPS O-acetylase OafA/YrhL|nr:acyltransferase [Zoogloeaceae bacterium]